MTTATDTINELTEAISANLDEANEIMRVTHPHQAVYVVMVGETLIRFQDMTNPNSPADPTTCNIARATVLYDFTMDSLNNLAHAVTNGAGEHGRIVRLYDAAVHVAHRSTELLAQLEEAGQVQGQ